MLVSVDVKTSLAIGHLHVRNSLVARLLKERANLLGLTAVWLIQLSGPHIRWTLLIACVLGKGRSLMHIHRPIKVLQTAILHVLVIL